MIHSIFFQFAYNNYHLHHAHLCAEDCIHLFTFILTVTCRVSIIITISHGRRLKQGDCFLSLSPQRVTGMCPGPPCSCSRGSSDITAVVDLHLEGRSKSLC